MRNHPCYVLETSRCATRAGHLATDRHQVRALVRVVRTNFACGKRRSSTCLQEA